MKVLVADDDPTTRALLCAVLADLGHEAAEAADGAAAWTSFQDGKPPLVVLDIEMPEMDGLEVCRRIRSVDNKRETFILVLTGRDHPEDLAAVLDAGADDYVTKPTTVEHLRARFVIAERRSAEDAARRHAESELAVARWRAGIGEAAIALQHEINNPLAALLGHAELLLMEYQERGEHNEQAQVVLDQARRIADVVKRIAKLRNPQTVEYIEGARMLDLSRPAEDK
jgi:DNA-binding response OmpR family regulator